MSRLDEIEQRLADSTSGPWESYRTKGWGHDNYVVKPDGSGVAMQYALVWQPGDAELIACAPADLAALVAFAREVERALDDHESTNEQVFDNLDGAMKRLNGGAS